MRAREPMTQHDRQAVWPKSRFFLTLLAFVLANLTLYPQSAKAQVDAGAIVGTVRDSSGGVVPAKVTLTNKDTGSVQQTTANQRGEYTFDPVRIGTYSVTAEMPGFQRIEQQNVVITVQQHALVD